MRARARRALAFALLAALLGGAVARADYKESYRQGIKARDNKEWPEMAGLMRSAAAEQPKESGEKVKIYGVRFEPYLPHFFLGVALFQQGDCEGALAQFKESEDQGAVQATAHYPVLNRHRTICQQRLAAKPAGEPPRPSTPDPAEAAKAAQKAEAEKQAKILADRQAEAQARDRNERNERNERKAAEERDKKALEERERKAAEARERQRQEEEARQAAARKEAENRELAARQALEQEIGRAAGDARRVLARAGAAKAGDAELSREKSRLAGLLKKGAAPPPQTTPLPELARLRDDLTAATSALDAALAASQGKAGPPAELRAAARAFFRADYQEVVRTLGKASFAERRAQAASHLLLAAARHALFVEGGEKDAELRRQALENVRACRRAAPRVTPDPRAFSPRFTEFWKAAG